MKQETSSAIAEAALCINGCGSKDEPLMTGLVFENTDFVASYVVKKAPAKTISECFQKFGGLTYMKVL